VSQDRHQLAGVDDRERGFNRPVEIEAIGQGFRAVLQYERLHVTTEPQITQDQALYALIHILHAQGFRQLKTQRSFRAGVYLGSQESWVEYPDPSVEPAPQGFFATLIGWLRRA